MKLKVCFIDDDTNFEIPLFLEAFDDLCDVVAGTDLTEVKLGIRKRTITWAPDLFVLDLYFPYEAPDQTAIAQLRRSRLEVETDDADMRTAYRNYVVAKNRLKRVLEAWHQSPDGGIKLAEKVGSEFPGTPVVFYSRKATFEDAVRCMALENVRGVLMKPTAKDDAGTRELTKGESARLVAEFREAADSRKKSQSMELTKAAIRVWSYLRDYVAS